jgi:SHS2 domain-containing protein
MTNEKNYELLDSVSELRMMVYGHTIKDLFLHALKAMFLSIEPVFTKDEKIIRHQVSCHAPDRDLLLINFLADVLALSDIHNEAYTDVQFIEFSDTNIKAVIGGKKINGLNIEIKAVTHHAVHIEQKQGIYQTEILFDI